MDERVNAKILAVDDTELNIDIIVNALQDNYDLRVALKGSEALRLIHEELPDLILLDINMPEMDGFEVCQKIKQIPGAEDIPVIFVSANSHLESKIKAFELGGVDYIVKPYNVFEIKSRINTQLEIKFSRELLSNENSNLTKMVNLKTQEVLQMRAAIIQTLASLAETRDDDIGHHIIRTQLYVKVMLDHMKHLSHYKAILTDELVENIILATPLHDIGKIGIPDAILLKPGRLSPEEFEIMKGHTHMGMKAMQVAAEAIPLAARLVAIADVYDALISKRVYKEAMGHSEAVKVIIKGEGHHFDPGLIEVFLQTIDDFIAIAQRYKDHHH